MSRWLSTAPGSVLRAILGLLLANAALGQETVVPARIVGITDGTTVKALAAGNQLLRIRLSWIDAPERLLVGGPNNT
jgi:endonuclease YncB( thermonuclease family)